MGDELLKNEVLAKYLALDQRGHLQAEYIWIGGMGLEYRSKTRTLFRPKVEALEQIPVSAVIACLASTCVGRLFCEHRSGTSTARTQVKPRARSPTSLSCLSNTTRFASLCVAFVVAGVHSLLFSNSSAYGVRNVNNNDHRNNNTNNEQECSLLILPLPLRTLSVVETTS
jgi:hypothetical protein